MDISTMIFVICVYKNVLLNASGELVSDGKFITTAGARIKTDSSTIMKTFLSITIIDCARICFEDDNCCEADYNSHSNECILERSGCCNHTKEIQTNWTNIHRDDGPWFNWSPWSSCSTSCGGGTRSRVHLSSCSHTFTDVEECHKFDCSNTERSCRDWMDQGLVDSSYRVISIGQPLNDVEVFCDMNSTYGDVVTVIGHDALMEKAIDGYEADGSYNYTLQYDIPFEHAVAIIDGSSSCRQRIRYKCRSALIHAPPSCPCCRSTTYWTNRTTHYLSAGSYKPPSPFFHETDNGGCMCACGIHQTCQAAGVVCNCDINDAVWREDDGYVTNKDSLPVVGFFAGDTGSSGEQAIAYVGPIECA